MMSKYTPGPWEIDRRCNTYILGGRDGRRGICSTGGYSNNTIDPEVLNNTNAANARLIKQAPNLLELCEAFVELAPSASVSMAEAEKLLVDLDRLCLEATHLIESATEDQQ